MVDYLVKRDNLNDSSVVTEAMIEKNLKGYKIHKTKEANKNSNKKAKTETMDMRENSRTRSKNSDFSKQQSVEPSSSIEFEKLMNDLKANPEFAKALTDKFFR